MKYRFSRVLVIMLSLLICASSNFTLSITIDNKLINVPALYTFQLTFIDSTTRSITLNFPMQSSLKSPLLTVTQNGILLSTGYAINYDLRTITIPTPAPFLASMKFVVANVLNPTSARQYQFTVAIVPTDTQTAIPVETYLPGSLISSVWTFSKFTGSSNSILLIQATIGNKLFDGPNSIIVSFPNFQDSNANYLTKNSSLAIVDYKLPGMITYTISPSPQITTTSITFNIVLIGDLATNSLLTFRISGIQNPDTKYPTGLGFGVATIDSLGNQVDGIVDSTVTPLAVTQLTAHFYLTSSLYVNSYYSQPKIIINTIVPFIISIGDVLQINHPPAMKIMNSSSLTVQSSRIPNFLQVYNYLPASTTTTSKFFVSTLRDAQVNTALAYLQFIFDIFAPFSTQPWAFVFWLKRNTGPYLKINANLQATAMAVSASKASLTISSTEMAYQSSYTLTVTTTNIISNNGQILLSFSPDFTLVNGACSATIGGIPITSSATCQVSLIGSLKWLVFQIGGDALTMIPGGTQIVLTYPTLITNALYPNIYNFGLEIYYDQTSTSLVQYAINFYSITLTTHYPTGASLTSNGFTVFEQTVVTISYKNDVILPDSSIFTIQLPSKIFSFDFLGVIKIADVSINLNSYSKDLTLKTITFTTSGIISPSTIILIPMTITMPTIVGSYPSIIISIKKGVLYQQVNSELSIQVSSPSTDLIATMQPFSNNMVGAGSSYILHMQSQVPLPPTFDIYLTFPSDIQQTLTLNCISSSVGTCSSISMVSSTQFKITITDSTYTLIDTFQNFIIRLQQFTNRRSTAQSQSWVIETKALYQTMASVSTGSTVSKNFAISNNVICSFSSSYSYYKSNTEPVLINCIFHSDIQNTDTIDLIFQSNSYTQNGVSMILCTSTTSINCNIKSQSFTTLVLTVILQASLTVNKNQLSIQITGLISNANTAYVTPPAPLAQIIANRYDGTGYSIDQGIFYYDISCNENSIIRGKKCKTCVSNQCQSCYALFYKLNMDSCVSNCPSSTQYTALNDVATFTCENCIFPCKSCQTLTKCITCSLPTHLLLTTTYTCVPSCSTSNGYFIDTISDPTQKMCSPCGDNCLVCKDSTYYACILCNVSFVNDAGHCALICSNPLSYTFNAVCKTCDYACQTCDGAGANNCIKCRVLYWLNNGYCVQNCPTNKYQLSNGTCGCTGLCATCTSSSPSYCSSCLDTSLILVSGQCVSSCPTSTLLISNTCQSCPSNCLSCSSTTTCTTCLASYFIYQSACYSDCNSISFQYDSSSSTCVLCPTGCDTCTGSDCSTCLSGYTIANKACILNCILTDSCVIPSTVPTKILTVPGSLAFAAWTIIVFITKFFVPKLYMPYSMLFGTALIQFIEIICSIISSKSLNPTLISRLLISSSSSSGISIHVSSIYIILICVICINYLSNIVFCYIFYKYIKPLILKPKQIDYISITIVWIIGMLTNYRFCLLLFSKMFSKPSIYVDYQTRLTPVHYICLASTINGLVAIVAAALAIWNLQPLTDLFMLSIDIILLELILLCFSIWVASCNKPQSYFQEDIKKYHLQDVYKTEEHVLPGKDQKNLSKHQLFRDQSDQKDQNLLNQDLIISNKKTNNKISNLDFTKHDSQTDRDGPLKNNRNNKIDIESLQIKKYAKNKQNTFDRTFPSDLSELNQKSFQQININGSHQKILNNDIQEQQPIQRRKKSIQKQKFMTQQQQMQIEPTVFEKGMISQINQPSSDQIPNLPLNQSIFHQRSSSEFGNKLKQKKAHRPHQKSQIIHNKKKSLKKNNVNLNQSDQVKKGMKKKNRFFQEQSLHKQQNDDKSDLDLQAIIQSKIVIVHNQKNKQASFVESSIDKKDDEQSDFNEQISPSWFNIQNQRFDYEEYDSFDR